MVADTAMFFWYAENNVDADLFQRLLKHIIGACAWKDTVHIASTRDILGGANSKKVLATYLDSALIVLPLLSVDFPWGDSTTIEHLMQRHEQGNVRIIPILLRAFALKTTSFAPLQVLPSNRLAVIDWTNEDSAFKHIVGELNRIVPDIVTSHLLRKAQDLFQEKAYEDALTCCDQVIRLRPRSGQARMLKADILSALLRYEEALDVLRNVNDVDLPPIKKASFFQQQAMLFLQLKHYDQSLLLYNKSLKSDSTFIPARLGKARALFFLHRYDEALSIAENALHSDRITGDHLLFIGDLHFLAGHYDQALEMYTKSISLIPRNPLCYEHKGKLLYRMQRYEDALIAYNQAIALVSQVSFHKEKGAVLLTMGRFEDAFVIYEDALNIFHLDVPFLYEGKGHALLGLMRYEEALAAYKTAIAYSHEHSIPRFYNALGKVYTILARLAYDLEAQSLAHGPEREDAGDMLPIPTFELN